MATRISVIIPACNEATNVGDVVRRARKVLPESEILVVDDGSIDGTGDVARAAGARIVRHCHRIGNGAAVKTGARAASGDVLVLMDADGQHRPEDIPALLKKFDEGFDMVVGARGMADHAGVHRGIANRFFAWLASWMVNQRVADLTSGFRVVRRRHFLRFLYMLPNGFSYPTTCTMSFFRAGLAVTYVPVSMPRRVGKSHIRPLRDGVRFILIIIRIGTLYSPLKLFLPISGAFLATGLGYYLYTFLSYSRFTNMSALLLSTGVLVFLIGLVSEQITMLTYKDSDRDTPH